MIVRALTFLFMFVLLLSFMSDSSIVKAQTEDDISGFIKQGQECYERGDLTGAALEFENILLIDRQNFSARVWLAQIFVDLKDLEKARKLLREAALQAPDHPKVIQLQKLLGEIKKPVSVTTIDPVVKETMVLIGSGTRLRPFGLVIPEEKVIPDTSERDLLVFGDIEVVEEKPEEKESDLLSYFDQEESPLAEVFKALEKDGINAALDLYIEKVIADPSLSAKDDKGLVVRGIRQFSERFNASVEDTEARYYYGALQYINGLYPEAQSILAPMRNNPGDYSQRLRPILAGLDKWQDQENQRIAMAKRAEEERLAREALEKAEAEKKKKPSAWAGIKKKRAEEAASGTADAGDAASAPAEAVKIHAEGYELYKKGKLDEAIEKYQAALTIQENNPEFNYHMGLAWTDKGLAGDQQAFDRAIASFQRVMALAPNDKLAKDSEAMIKDIDSAKKTLGE